jgi:hypothetical protein
MPKRIIMRRLLLLLIILAACSPAPSQEQTLPTIAVLPTGTPVPTLVALVATVQASPTPTLPPTEALSCPKLVTDAMSLVAGNCADLNRDEICYGNVNLNIEPHSNAPAFTFEKTGDITDISNIANLRLSSMDLTQNAWGMAMMKIAANVPETLPGQGVTFLLFGDVEIEPSDTEGYGTMQAFYFKTGFRDRPCAEAPDSGLLIQTPRGTTKISLLVNEVQIELGSTVYLQAQPNGEMRVNTVEGSVIVSASGISQPAPAGTFVTIPLDTNGIASGPPSPPQPYNAPDLAALPLPVLPDDVAIAPALSSAAIQTAIATQTPSSGALLPGVSYFFFFEQGEGCESDTDSVIVDADGSLYIDGSLSPSLQESPDVYHRVTAGGADLGTYTVSGTQVTFKIDADGINRNCSGSISVSTSIFHFPADNACNVIEYYPFRLLEDNSAILISPTGAEYPLIRESPTVYTRMLENGRKERYSLSTVMQVQYAIEDGTSGAVICSVDGQVEVAQGA